MSMTNEEAIERLERLKRSCRDLAAGMPDEPGWTLHGMALDMALTALRPVSREQVERMRGEWRSIHGLSEYYCSRCGEEFEIHAYDKEKYRFCPHCMAPMTDEAVQMVMERLEALHDNRT